MINGGGRLSKDKHILLCDNLVPPMGRWYCFIPPGRDPALAVVMRQIIDNVFVYDIISR